MYVSDFQKCHSFLQLCFRCGVYIFVQFNCLFSLGGIPVRLRQALFAVYVPSFFSPSLCSQVITVENRR